MSDPFEQRAEDYKALALTLAQMFSQTDKSRLGYNLTIMFLRPAYP